LYRIDFINKFKERTTTTTDVYKYFSLKRVGISKLFSDMDQTINSVILMLIVVSKPDALVHTP